MKFMSNKMLFPICLVICGTITTAITGNAAIMLGCGIYGALIAMMIISS